MLLLNARDHGTYISTMARDGTDIKLAGTCPQITGGIGARPDTGHHARYPEKAAGYRISGHASVGMPD